MNTYVVSIDTDRDPEVEFVPDIHEQTADSLLDALIGLDADLGAAVTYGSTGVGVTLTVEGRDPVDAIGHAEEMLHKAAVAADIHFERLPIVQLEVTEYERFVAQVETPDPQLVGVSELMEFLGVSRQRVSELRAQPAFPAPAAELKAGPVWLLPNLQRFVEEWDRRPGRKKKRPISPNECPICGAKGHPDPDAVVPEAKPGETKYLCANLHDFAGPPPISED